MSSTQVERRRWPRWSVRARILTSILLVAALGLAAAGFTSYLVQRERVLADIDDQLTITAEQVRYVATGQSPVGADDEPLPDQPSSTPPETTDALLRQVMQRVVPHHNESSLGIVDGAARFLPGVAVSFVLTEPPGLVERIVREVTEAESSVLGTYHGNGYTLRYLAVAVVVPTDTVSGIFLTAVDIDAELAALDSAFRTYTWVAFAALAAIAAVGWFVAWRLLRPLRALERTTSRITLSDLSERIPVDGNDDVSQLGRTVNRMLTRLDGAVTAQRQLLDDVRHELRTPVTIMRGHLELMNEADPSEVNETRLLVVDELDRMTQLISDIELLADSDAVGTQVVLAPTDIGDLTQKVFAKAKANREHIWVLGEVAEVVAQLDASRISQAWLQLVDNAVKHTPPGSTVEIGSRVGGGGVELQVADDGPGIPAEALDRIFDRFGRADTSRGTHGSGLGLNIVRAIVTAHGGSVTAVNTSPGVSFTMTLPMSMRDGSTP